MAILFFGTSNSSYPDQHKNEDGWKQSSFSTHPIAANSILEESTETPNFKIDPKVIGTINSHWIPSHLDTRSGQLLSAVFKKSTPLFDVKTTFLHFFYTW